MNFLKYFTKRRVLIIALICTWGMLHRNSLPSMGNVFSYEGVGMFGLRLQHSTQGHIERKMIKKVEKATGFWPAPFITSHLTPLPLPYSSCTIHTQ